MLNVCTIHQSELNQRNIKFDIKLIIFVHQRKTQIFEHFIWSCYELSVQSDSVSGLSTLTICPNGLVIVTLCGYYFYCM